jgi:hypothetical protein
MKSTAAVEVEVLPKGGADTVVKNFKTQLKEAKNEAQLMVQTFGEFSAEALAAQKKVAELADKMEDFNDRVKALNPDKFAKVQTIVQGVSRGFQAAQGAMALFGSESEDLQKTLVKVQGAMALADGLEGLGKIQQQFLAIGKSVVGPVISAFKSFGTAARTAIASTGIGVLVVALGVIVAYWDDIRMALTGVNKETEKLNKSTNDNLKKSKEQTDEFETQVNTLKLQGKSEKEIEQLRIKAYDNEIERNIERLNFLKTTQKAQVDAVQSNFDFVNKGLKIFQAPLVALLKVIDVARRALGQESNLANQATESVASLLFNPKETKEKSDAEIKEVDKAIKELQSKRDASRLNIKKADEEATKTSTDNFKNRQKTEQQIQAQLLTDNAVTLKQKLDAAKATFEIERAELIKQGVSKKLIQEKENSIIAKVTKDFNDKKKADEEKAAADLKAAKDKFVAADMQQIQDKYQKEINFIKLRDANLTDQTSTNEQIAQKELESLEEQYKEKERLGITDLALAQQIADKKRGIRDTEIAEEEKKAQKEKEIQTAKYNAVNDSLGAIGEIYSAFASTNEEDQKKAFEVNKATSIAQAIVNTWEGVTAALANKNQLFPGQNLINAGLSLAAGLVAVKKISDTTYQSKNPNSSGSPTQASGQGTMQSFAPRTNSLALNDSLTQNRQVYVTEGDITRTQRRVSNNQAISVVE